MPPLRFFFGAIVIGVMLPTIASAQTAPDPVPPAFAALPAIDFQYYDVRGTTQAEIAVALRAASLNAPALVEAGKPNAAARTRWKADFAWDRQTMSGLCRTRLPRTRMSVIVILPHLVDADRADPSARDAWRTYITDIQRHEAGHARIAFAHARDFEAEAYGAPCDQIQAIGRRIVERITALQEDYERRTDFGRAQGDIVE